MICLEKIEIEDLPLIMNWRMDQEVTKYMYTNPVLNLNKQKQWYFNISNNKKCKYWIIKCEEDKIGIINLNNIDMDNKRCSWEYYIGNLEYRGKGIAPIIEYNLYEYIFEELKFNKVWCELMSYNTHAIRIHEKMGVEKEALFKEHILKEGTFHDVVIMGITKKKWRRIKENYNFEKIEIEVY